MPRYAKATQTIDDLKKKILSLSEEAKGEVDIGYAVYEILSGGRYRMPKIKEDLSVIEVDGENAELIGEFSMPGTEKLDKFEILNGVPVAWCGMGGDWEMPVVVALYIDDEGDVRAYIPFDGNAFNHEAKSAYGNGNEGDDFDMKRAYVFDADKIREDVKCQLQVK